MEVLAIGHRPNIVGSDVWKIRRKIIDDLKKGNIVC